MYRFRSDNNAGLCPEAMQAIVDANHGHVFAYGEDPYTEAALARICGIFGETARAWFVGTGTAANTLAVASMTRPWEQVLSHVHSHYNDDESTTPERITHCRTVQIRTESSKLEPADLERAGVLRRGDVHQPQPGVLTLSNPTEFGTVYTGDEVKTLCDAAHAAGYRVHVDGARFANAVAAAGCDPRVLADKAGVDALSFGGTKNGLACGEAVIFFPQGDGRVYEEAITSFAFHRKSTGHLLSKHRFVTAPFAATLGDGVWLRHAAHANEMASRLAAGLEAMGYRMRFPAEANGVFVTFSAGADAAMRERGHAYYRFGDPAWDMYRLMCSFDTTAGQVDALLADAEAAADR